MDAGTRLEMYGCELIACGHGDDVCPRDLGALEIQARVLPLAKLAPPIQPPIPGYTELWSLCSTYIGANGGSDEAAELSIAMQRTAEAGMDRGASGLKMEEALSVSNGHAPLSHEAVEASLSAGLCQLDQGATIIIGPGCKITGNR